MLSSPGLLNEAVRMEKQQVGNHSRLSLDQRFSGGVRRLSTRSRHQSLDRRFSQAAREDSQAASRSLGQRTIGADDKRPAAARSVCPSIPVALSVHCRSDEPNKHTDNADESMEQWSTGQRTTGAGRRPSTATSATVEAMDNSRQLLDTTATTVDTTEDSQAVQWSLRQRTVGADKKRPTTARSVYSPVTVPPSVHRRSDDPGSSMDKAGKSQELQSLGQRTIGADLRLPTTSSAAIRTLDYGRQPSAAAMSGQCIDGLPSTTATTTVGAMDNEDQLPMTSLRCQWKQAHKLEQGTLDHGFRDSDRHQSATGLYRLGAAVEQQDNPVGPQ